MTGGLILIGIAVGLGAILADVIAGFVIRRVRHRRAVMTAVREMGQ